MPSQLTEKSHDFDALPQQAQIQTMNHTFYMTLTGAFEQIENVAYLTTPEGIRFHVVGELPEKNSTDASFQWEVVPRINSDGLIAAVQIIRVLGNTSKEDNCQLTGKVTQVGRRRHLVLLEVFRAGEKTLKLTLQEQAAQMKVDEIWQVVARREGNYLQIVSASRIDLLPEPLSISSVSISCEDEYKPSEGVDVLQSNDFRYVIDSTVVGEDNADVTPVERNEHPPLAEAESRQQESSDGAGLIAPTDMLLVGDRTKPVPTGASLIAPTDTLLVGDRAKSAPTLDGKLGISSIEETTSRLTLIARLALADTTGQDGWVLNPPVKRSQRRKRKGKGKSRSPLAPRRSQARALGGGIPRQEPGNEERLWEWEAVLPDSDNGNGQLLKARVQVDSYTEAVSVYEFLQVDALEEPEKETNSEEHPNRLIVTPLGAARSIGASCFRVEMGPYEIVLDAGTRPKGNNPLPAFEHLLNPNLILITHAHQDHIGALPVFHRQFPGARMICTTGTREIAHVMLTDCLKVQQSNEEYEQLFDEIDLEETLFRLETQPVGVDFEPLPGLQVRFIHAGHIVGAACTYLRYGERSLLYTGDYNTTSSRTTDGLRIADLPEADILITESTYGADAHPSRKAQETELLKAVAEVVQNGGNVLIPAFALGRAQEILLAIRTSSLFYSLKIPVYVDGLVRAVTDVFRDRIELLPIAVQNFAQQQEPFFAPEGTPPIIPISHPRERPLAIAKPSVIIASSGMLTGGASVYYGKALLERENAAVFISGYTDEESPGRFLQNLQKGEEIEIEGKKLTVRALIKRFNLSAHADKIGLAQVIHKVNPKQLILIHGSPSALHELAETGDIKDKYIVHIPSVGEAVEYGVVPSHITSSRLARIESPQEFELNIEAEIEGVWLRFPEVVMNDPRWAAISATGVLKAKWTGRGLYLIPVSQHQIAIEAARRSGEDCCAVCEFLEKRYCQCPSSPLFTRDVDPRGICVEFHHVKEREGDIDAETSAEIDDEEDLLEL